MRKVVFEIPTNNDQAKEIDWGGLDVMEYKISQNYNLTRAQSAAIDHITQYARTRKNEANKIINEILQMSNFYRENFDNAVTKIKTHARVALHFHPDRPDQSLKSVAEALLDQGIYRNQFETLISNGSVSAFSGGERDQWERQIFGEAYHLEISTPSERPKYGALDLMLHPDGPAPRFGSCYFLLLPEVSYRCTYTYLDSHDDPKEKGTFYEFDDILAALMKDAFVSDFAIGERNLTPSRLVEHLLVNLDKPFIDPSTRMPNRNLNHYIETQVHGDIRLKDDVEILVADPSFKGTQVGKILREICSQYSIDLYWHSGFTMSVNDVPTDFRGPSMPSLAKRIAQDGYIYTSTIGVAAMDLKHNPLSWSERGSFKEVLQELKLLWHVLVRYGKPLNLEYEQQINTELPIA